MKASEARKQWKEVLDRAAKGEMIQIERGGVVFALLAKNPSLYVPEFKQEYNIQTNEVSSNIRPEINIKQEPGLVSTVDNGGLKKSRLATPTTLEDKLKSMQEKSGMKFCPNGHAIPEGRSKCMGKGCKYA